MNNNRWLSLALLIVLLIAGVLGAGYLLFQRNQSEMDKETALKQIQTYIIEKDHRSAYDLADSLVARYPEDENLISLRKALSELIGESDPFDSALSSADTTDNGISTFDLETIEPITPRPDRSQEIVASNEPATEPQETSLPSRQEVPPVRGEDLTPSSLLNGLSQDGANNNNNKAPETVTPIPRPERVTAPAQPVTPPAPTREEPVRPAPQPVAPTPVATPEPARPVTPPTPVVETPAPAPRPVAPVITEADRRRAEQRRVRVALFESLDAIQTGQLDSAKTKLDNLLSEGSIDPDFRSVSDLLGENKQREARERLEQLLGSGIVFPSIDQSGKQSPSDRVENIINPEQGTASGSTSPAGTEAPASSLDLAKIQAMDLKNPSERANAKAQLEAHLKENPNDATALGLLASLADADGDADKAIALYEQAVALSPRAEDYYALGGLYFHKKDYNKSADAYNKSLELNPTNTRAYNNLGIDYIMLAQDDKAIDSFNKAVANEPSYANGFYQLGRVYKRNGNLDSALANFQKAYDLDKTRLTYTAELANSNLEKGNFTQADGLYTQALAGEPNNEALLYNAAQAKSALKQYPAGLALIEKALVASPNNLSYRLVKADILDLMGNKAGAEAEYKAVADADPKDVLSRVNLGSLYTSQKKYAEAKTVLEQAQTLAPENGAVQNNLGAMLIDQQQFASAIPYLQKATNLGVKEAQYNLGLAYFEEKQDANAKAIFDAILGETPDNWDALYLSGLLDYRMNNATSGRTKLQRVLQGNPSFGKRAEVEQLLNS